MPAFNRAHPAPGWRRASGIAAVLLSLSMAHWPLSAQTSSASSADQIRLRAARLKELRDLLNDREPTVRLAAFSELVNSPDPTSQELGFEAGFSSADGAIRALAVRKRLMRLTTVSLVVTEASGESIAKAQKDGRPNAAPTHFGWNVLQADEAGSSLRLSERRDLNPEQTRAVQASLMVSGQTVAINTRGYRPECDGTLVLDDSNALTGAMSCWSDHFPGLQGGTKVLLKVRLRVN